MWIDKSTPEPCQGHIVRITGHPTLIWGMINLLVIVGEGPRTVMTMTKFVVLQLDSAYNGLVGRPLMLALRAILSPNYQMIKFPTSQGPGVW